MKNVLLYILSLPHPTDNTRPADETTIRRRHLVVGQVHSLDNSTTGIMTRPEYYRPCVFSSQDQLFLEENDKASTNQLFDSFKQYFVESAPTWSLEQQLWQRTKLPVEMLHLFVVYQLNYSL